MQVDRTIHQGLRVLGDVTGVDYSFVNGIMSGTLLVAGETTLSAALLLPGIPETITAKSLYYDPTTKVVSYGDENAGSWVSHANGIYYPGDPVDKANVGIGVVSDLLYKLYVYEDDGLDGKIAKFDSLVTGPAFIVVGARSTQDAQLHFQENNVAAWVIGNDGGTNNFVISDTEGSFTTSTDKLRLGASDAYLYGDAHLNMYFVARTGGANVVIQPVAGNDASILFRQDGDTQFASGYDAGDDVYKITPGTSLGANSVNDFRVDTGGLVVLYNRIPYEPLQETWTTLPKHVLAVTRPTSTFGINDYSAIQLSVRPTASHFGRAWFGAYSDTPSNHHAGFFVAVSGTSDQTTIFKGSVFGDFHFQAESGRDLIVHFAVDQAAVMTTKFVMGYDDGDGTFHIEGGSSFTSGAAIQVFTAGGVRMGNLAGTGTRNVVVDASGNLSAP